MQITSGVLAVSGDGGYPYAVPLSYVYDDSTYYLQSIMHDKMSMLIAILRSVVVSGLLIYVLPLFFHITGVWIAMPISEVIVAVIALCYISLLC